MVAHSNSVLCNGSSEGTHDGEPFVDCLIVGTGPAGGALACFLAQNGIKGLMVSQDTGTADTPRAHITNMAALDCLRDIGLDKECYAIGTGAESMLHTRWSSSFAGEEYARIYSWGNDPARKGDYELASPSDPLDLPQTLLEPILVRYATRNGFQARFDTSFVSFEQTEDSSPIRTKLLDRISGQTYHVRCKYLLGADGARSQIARQLELPMIKRPSQGFAVNILIEADMAHLMETRMGNLHWLLPLDTEPPDFAWIGCIRMVKPWHEWLCIVFPAPSAERQVRPAEDYMPRIREFIGDDTIDVKVKGISTWVINETAAKVYSKGNVFCLGDAVHRHPPNHGLGSNTCIQDAHNLAWKIAYVEKGLAGRALLDSYNDERQPVGLDVVTQANASLRNHFKIWETLGIMESNVAARLAAFRQLSEDSLIGNDRRAALQEAVKRIHREEQGLGIEMNQRYHSNAVLPTPGDQPPAFDTDPLAHYHPTTYPGARLPHAWLSKCVPSKAVSTIDLAGDGKFALFTGIGGDGWKVAARKAEKDLSIPIAAYSIGFRQEWEDRYMRWRTLRGVGESGCVSVRPDRFVVWRSQTWIEDGEVQLITALKTVLSRS